ncbi:acyl carrier protein [Amycolatopsis mediterranei S699]|uniref:Acyl carrier protein n=2 Tax=Amycolatopsis mediterranei TaxID=33910 RepID=A0A9R0NXS5_AMYMS|nr:putative acyl carrier protein [Amycolatopsis mediterranei U32]AEK42603.1 acyl carrier protein [Amycolatopsis mediterranei S699]AFO77533.1 acyl carrier protein [Amycolatopsis mediterranei S699]AGT84661.1 acyl carrier protein [Amycolatopsis mediterranei RB]
MSERREQIRAIVREHLELEDSELSPTSNFIEDHEADSLTLMDVLAALEKEFGVTIDQAQFRRMVDLDSAYEVVAESAGW